MFNTQIKLDLQELTERVDLMERQLCKLYKEIAMVKNPSNVPYPAGVRPSLGKRHHHTESYLFYLPGGGIDIGASLKSINRTIHEVMAGSWPKNSAENRIDTAVRRVPGQKGLLSREEWMRRNPEQLDLFR